MLIYIIRHGKAQDSSESGRDEDRMLKKKGFRQAEAIGVYLGAHECPPEMVLCSPLIRARETAGPIWEALGQEEQVDDRLGTDRSLSDALDVLIDARGAKAIAIVGHNPTCARLVSLLTLGLSGAAASHRTGELAVVKIEGTELVGSGRLVEQYRLED